MQPLTTRLKHVVWDWNGTLLDDLWAVVDATNESLRGFGAPALTPDEYRAVFSRPVRSFHEGLVGRSLTDLEWQLLDDAFYERYGSLFGRVELVPSALRALSLVQTLGLTQSVLSMTRHIDLLGQVRNFDLDKYFLRVEGSEGNVHSKLEMLASHLGKVDVDPSLCALIGDTTDDGQAAASFGMLFIPVGRYSFERADSLRVFGIPARSVSAAVERIASVLGQGLGKVAVDRR